MSARTNTVVAASLVVLFWASGFVAVEIGLRELSPGQLALARYLVSALVFAGLLTFRKIAIPRPADLIRMAFVGAIGISAYNLALNHGQLTVSAGVASLLVNTVPIWTSLLSMILLKEHIHKWGWIGTAIAFSGVAIIALHRGGWFGFDVGALLIIGAAIAQALYFVIAKPLLERYHPIDVTSYMTWFGCLFLIPFGCGLETALPSASLPTICAILFLGIATGALAYLAWAHVIATMPAGKASQILFLVPVVALILGWLILGQIPASIALIGGFIAILGVVVGRKPVR